MGLVQCFQYPVEIPGVRLGEFVDEAAAEAGIENSEQVIAAAAEQFDMTRFLDRSVNDDLSGGEKAVGDFPNLRARSQSGAVGRGGLGTRYRRGP